MSHLWLRPEECMSDFCTWMFAQAWGRGERARLYSLSTSCVIPTFSPAFSRLLGFLRGPCLACPHDVSVVSPGWGGSVELGGQENPEALSGRLSCPASHHSLSPGLPALPSVAALELHFSVDPHAKMSQKLSPLVSPPGLFLSGVLLKSLLLYHRNEFTR